MGFGVRLAPGVRVRVSSRGVRTSVGPRVARVHVGAGRPAISTGIGPFSYSTSLGGGSSSRSGGSRSGQYQSYYSQTPTQANKQAEAQAIEARLKELTQAHTVQFEAAQRPIAEREAVRSQGSIYREYKREDLIGVGFFKFAERKSIKLAAQEKAEKAHQELEAAEDVAQAERQAVLDAEWELLLSNDLEILMTTLTDAFGDNEAKAAVLGVEGAKAHVLVLAPDVSVLPERDWSITDAGNLSVKKMTAGQRNNYYFDLVFSQLVATLNEAFAVAPGLKEISLILVRNRANEKLGKIALDCLGFGTASRDSLAKALQEPSPFSIIMQATDFWENDIDDNLKLRAMDLSNQPEIKTLLADVVEL